MSSAWYFLDAEGKPLGPYDEHGLQGLISGGFVHKASSVWCDGRPEWQPISGIPELAHLLAAATFERPTVAPVTSRFMSGSRASGGAAGAAAARKGKSTGTTDADLAAFRAEIDALDGVDGSAAQPNAAPATTSQPHPTTDPTTAAAAAQADSDTAAPSTPEELEFEDDDGTWYAWHPTLRKYLAKGDTALETTTDALLPNSAPSDAAAAATHPATQSTGATLAHTGAAPASVDEYDPEMMTYSAEDEVLPSLSDAKAAHEVARAIARGDDVAPPVGQASAAEQGAAKKGKRKQPGDDAAGGQAGDASSVPASRDGSVSDGGSSAPAADSGEAAAKGYKLKSLKKDAVRKPAEWTDLKVNTSIYVTGLPDDTDVDELLGIFSKCGVIKEDEKMQPKIKLYKDKASGFFKGDALVTYLKPASVDLACNILDGSMLRANSKKAIAVTPAKFEMKGDTFNAKAPISKAARKKALERLEQRSLGWGGFDDKVPVEKVTVVLKHMYEPDELLGEPQAEDDLEDDIKAECGKLGVVDKVRIFKTHPDGVITVKFKDMDAAESCVKLMNGRWFGGRQLVAHMYDGYTNYAVKAVKESAEEQASRLEAFSRELEAKAASATVGVP
ncbi:MAG: hypothetical protein WDW36_003045 [Sanguina aurantia]